MNTVFLFDLPLLVFEGADEQHVFWDAAGQPVCLNVPDNTLTPADVLGWRGEDVLLNAHRMVRTWEGDAVLMWADANPDAVLEAVPVVTGNTGVRETP